MRHRRWLFVLILVASCATATKKTSEERTAGFSASAPAARTLAATDFLRGLIPGRPRYRFGYRRASDLRNALVVAGFEVRDRTTLRGASRGRVLLEAVRRPTGVARD